MAAIDDFKAALASAENLMDQAGAFISGVPAVVAAAVQAQKDGDDKAVADLQTDLQTHADALTKALSDATNPAPAPTV